MTLTTGVTLTSVSGASGEYQFLELTPGTYTLTTVAAGFTTSVHQDIAVRTGSTVVVNISLQPGQVQQTVTVKANAAALETETSDIGTTISPQEMKDLPVSLSGDMRNPLNFVTLTPGVSWLNPRSDA